MLKKNLLIVMSSILCFPPLANALKITNLNDGTGIYAKQPMRVIVGKPSQYALDHRYEPGVCWKNLESYYSIIVQYGTSFNTDDILDSDGYTAPNTLCLRVEFPVDTKPAFTQQFATNPLDNNPLCQITFVKIASAGAGTARATPGCQYRGNPA